ncbi:MAG: lipid IV(A) 3-deoxy-D-manno-octulosonic acid transferase [Pseudomonadota bacterium]
MYPIIRVLYSGLLYACLPIVLLRLVWRSMHYRVLRARLRERFGILKTKPKPGQTLWIHAVSVGEIQSIVPFVQAFYRIYPHVRIHITTTTATGLARAETLMGHLAEVSFFPYDLGQNWTRFFKAVRPSMLILVESEIWPNLLHECANQKIPVIMANARLSQRSFRRWRRISGYARRMFQPIQFVGAQSAVDAERFAKVGIPLSKIGEIGNLKFDIHLSAESTRIAKQLRTTWGSRPVWIAASTHPGEEAVVLKVHQQLLVEWPDLILILVPRHPERFQGIAQLLEQQGVPFVTRSSEHQLSGQQHVYLGDTLGELRMLYQCADVAFVAGSLVPVGGHNPLEPAAAAIPSVMGPYVENCLAIVRALQDVGALTVIHQTDELMKKIDYYLSSPEERIAAGKAGAEWVGHNQGSCENLLNEVSRHWVESSH